MEKKSGLCNGDLNASTGFWQELAAISVHRGGRGLTLDNTKLPVPEAPYYTTDAFTDYAIRFVDEQKDDKPFFLYLAFNAPHWPLQAKEEDIQKFTKIYREKGWDEIREARRKRMTKLGIIEPNTEFAEWENRKWNELTEQEKDKVAYRMAVYAAQVHCVDYNVRKLLDYLKRIVNWITRLSCFYPTTVLVPSHTLNWEAEKCLKSTTRLVAYSLLTEEHGRRFPILRSGNTKCRSYEGGIFHSSHRVVEKQSEE